MRNIESRVTPDGTAIRRRHECMDCRHRFDSEARVALSARSAGPALN
jgi:transcriptional regulator NrdR family protein